MDMQKVLLEGRSHADMEATFAFKLPAAQKDEFVEICRIHGLSTGRVIRSLLDQFIESAKRGE